MSHVEPELYGVVAEFRDSSELLEAARRARDFGYQRIDAFSPFPLEGLSDSLGLPPTRIPRITLIGGIVGGLIAIGLMYYTNVVAYPINVGGRALFSWQAYVPITFELTVLGAALSAFFGMLIANGLPRLHYPLFNLPEFTEASRDRFFLLIDARDPQFDLQQTRELLQSLPGARVFDVPRNT